MRLPHVRTLEEIDFAIIGVPADRFEQDKEMDLPL